MNKQFQGIYAEVVTPFYEDGTFDVESAKKNLDWLIEQGVSVFWERQENTRVFQTRSIWLMSKRLCRM